MSYFKDDVKIRESMITHLRLFEEVVKFISRGLDLVEVGGVDHVDDGVDAAAVSLPHGAEPRLTADVPQLDGDVPLGDLAHVEPHRRNHVLVEVARGDDVDEGRLACMLQADEGQLHLLLPEEGLEPLEQAVYHSKHDEAGLGLFFCTTLDLTIFN